MRVSRIIVGTIILLSIVSAGCIRGSSRKVIGDEANPPDIAWPDFRPKGPAAYDRMEGKLTSSTGCEVMYTYLRPRTSSQDMLVVLGHGFLRTKERMSDLAGHLASWGLPVANVEFCNSKLWVGNHDLNGEDMVAVARKLSGHRILYAGFSAGGLAALAAAVSDDNSIALFGLDMVDHRGLGQKTAPELAIPFYGLVAAPSICNADRNGLQSYTAASDSKVIEIEDATHCHFEFPFDAKCSLACGKGEKRIKREVIQKTILGFTTAFMVWQTGINPGGKAWWSDGSEIVKILTEAGYIRTMKP